MHFRDWHQKPRYLKRIHQCAWFPALLALLSLPANAAPPVRVRISPTSASVATGQTQQFTATVTRTSNTLVKWSVNGVEGGSPSAGMISGAGLYTAPASVLSPATVTVTATSFAQLNRQASATVTVTGSDPAPPSPLTITTTTLPAGTVGSPYSFTLAASGGAPPYTWRVSAGQLPPGLALSTQGAISGTPSSSGVYGVTVEAKDSASSPATAIKIFSIDVASAPPQPTGAHYYVDSTNGSDSNSGTSDSAAWKTLTPVHNRVFQSGETVHFKRGGGWRGPLVIRNSGVSGNPIIFTDYGTGAKPVFSNPGVTWGHAIEIRASWVVVENILAQSAHEAGILITSGANNNIVRNSEMTQAGTGVLVSGQYNLITGNYAHDLTMIVDTSGGDDDYGAVGFWLYAPNNEVSYNRCVNCKSHSYDYGTDGGVVEIYNNGDNSYIHHNWGESSNGFMEIGGGSARNVVFAYNVSYNNGDLMCPHIGDGFSATVSNLRVENNTVVQTTNNGALFVCMGSVTSGTLSLRNNIFYTAGSVLPTSGSFTHENNNYYLIGGASIGYALGPNERIADPRFASLSAKDFRLQSGSPAVDTGANLGYTTDFVGIPVPQGAAPDIGSFEY